jgi:hypothetical protein
MPPRIIFPLQLVFGYIAWALLFATYVWPVLRAMESTRAQRAIATLHSFRFFGLVFLVPGVVGPNLPPSFAVFSAYWDFATALLAILALLTVRVRFLFWPLVTAFNLVGAIDLAVDYYHAIRSGLAMTPGELGMAYVIPVLIVPLLMITHIAAFYLLVRSRAGTVPSLAAVQVGG